MEALIFPDFKNLGKEVRPLEQCGADYKYRAKFNGKVFFFVNANAKECGRKLKV